MLLLRLILDHSAIKFEAESRGYGEQCFTESLYCHVTGYQTVSSDVEEVWDVSGFSEFLYCDEVLEVTIATIEGGRLCIHHDCRDYPENPIYIPIASVTEHDRYPAILPTLIKIEPMVLTEEEWGVSTTDFLAGKGLDVLTADWIDIEIAIREHAARTGVSKKFLLKAAKALRGGIDCL
jgi:hypothetical protein